MRLQSIQLARTTWLMDVGETNPDGRNIFVDLVPALVSEYHFKTVPQEGGDFKEGMKFTPGTFVNSSGNSVQVAFVIYSDGVAADTYSTTDDAEEFLSLVANLLLELGYHYDPSMIRRRVYLSQVFVRSTKSLAALNPRLAAFAQRISETTGLGLPYTPSGLEFWSDQSKVFKPAPFTFQKRAGDDPTEDRYWSQAPLTTKDHISLLAELEDILSP